MDNSFVQMLTTVQKVGPGYTVGRIGRRPRLTLTNGQRVRAVFDDSGTKLLPIPVIVDRYNYNMDRVDIADQLWAVYRLQKPTIRTWLSLFFWLLDVFVMNSYMLLSKLDGNWTNHHR